MSRGRFAVAALVALAPLLPACLSRSDLLQRASFDLACPEGQVALTDLGNDTFGVRGCGQQVTYVMLCEERTFGAACARGRWVMNNSLTRGQGA